MMRLVVKRSGAALVARASLPSITQVMASSACCKDLRQLYGPNLSDEQQDAMYTNFFNRSDIDMWELRRGINELVGIDAIPDPKIICACLRACRKLNDYAVTVRFLELIKRKCGRKLDKYYPYILQEIRPTLEELGCNLPEELGYDKPELWLEFPDNMH